MALEVERVRIKDWIAVGVERGNWVGIRVGRNIRLAHFVAEPKINEGFMSEAFHSMSQQDIQCDGEKDSTHGPAYSTQQYLFCNLYYKTLMCCMCTYTCKDSHNERLRSPSYIEYIHIAVGNRRGDIRVQDLILVNKFS